MTEVAVKSIDALQALHTELVRYTADAQDRIDQMARELRRTQAWLTERERHWGYEVARWQRELTQAQTALHRCVETVESWNKERSYGVDCSALQLRVSRAADNLDKATKALANVRHHLKQVNEAGTTFTTYAQRLSATLQKELPQAAELLNRSIYQLEAYTNLQASELHYSQQNRGQEINGNLANLSGNEAIYEETDEAAAVDCCVEGSRSAGLVFYKSSLLHAKEDSSWSFLTDGTIDIENDVEITPQGDIFGCHAAIKDYLKRAGVTGKRAEDVTNLESHHLIPSEVLRLVGIDENDGIAVAVDADEHMKVIHGPGGIEKNLWFTDVDDLKDYYVGKYKEFGVPEWGKKVEEFIEKYREIFHRGITSINSPK